MAGIGSGFQNGEEKARRLASQSRGCFLNLNYRYGFKIQKQDKVFKALTTRPDFPRCSSNLVCSILLPFS